VHLTADSSTSVHPVPGNSFLGGAEMAGSVVWAIDQAGAGRVAYASATELLNNEFTQCPLWDWLGAVDGAAPRVLGTGDFQCDAQDWNGLGELEDFTYESELPLQYVDNPAALRADFDIVLFCTTNWGNPPPVAAQTYVDYVAVHGGGLYLGAVAQLLEPGDDIDRINEIAVPLGGEFAKDDLAWDGTPKAAFACFPQ
jgi:hypothetical protein